jgi:antitoxin component YwqK of YwqJK toxin-antitoxin module
MLGTYRDINNTSRIMEMKFRHLLIIISLSLFALPSESLAECKEVKPEIKIDKEGNQVKHGLEVLCYPNGFMKWKGKWKNGKTEGKWTYWHDNGKKSTEVIYKDGKQDGNWTEWHDNGQKSMEYKDGKRTYWHKNGKKSSEGLEKDGKRHGKWTYWYDNGKKWMEGLEKDGKRHGKWTEWYETGAREETTYKDDEQIDYKLILKSGEIL